MSVKVCNCDRLYKTCADCGAPHPVPALRARLEAAERDRDAISDARDAVIIVADMSEKELTRARAEAARLRDALTRIRDEGCCPDSYGCCKEPAGIARAALEKDEGTT